MEALAIILFTLAGGWLSRMAGGGPPKLPFGLDQWLYAAPYLLISFPAASILASLIGLNEKHKDYFKLVLLLPYFGAFIGKRTGHGGGIDLGHDSRQRETEKLEYLIKPLHGKMPEYWYDVLLLSITGFAVTLIAGLMVCFISAAFGLLIIFSGLLKGPAYMIGWALYPKSSGRGIPHLNEATAIGEFLTGVFGWGAIAIAAGGLL